MRAERIGHYRLEKELGKGGMGVVYRARDERLKRTVALKTLLPGAEDAPDAIARFRREGQAVARLRHPNIVTVHELGEADGQAFIAMDYVKGVTLSKRLASKKGEPLTRRRAVEIVRDVARAVQHAHEQGVIHRDLKPQNVLLDADDHPFVVDFGLARLGGARTKLTRAGHAMGTPAYMSPEQARGETVGERSDVYSLGATLYHALTGRPPFEADGEIQVLAQVLTKAPLSPRALVPDVPVELAAVCLQALEKKPRQRYASAGSLADDLDRWLEGREVLARRRRAVVAPNWGVATALVVFVFLASAYAGYASGVGSWLVDRLLGRVTFEVTPDRPQRESYADQQARYAALAVQQKKENDEREAKRAAAEAADLEERSELHALTSDTGFPRSCEGFLKSKRTRLRLAAGYTEDPERRVIQADADSLALSADGTKALTGHRDRVARLFDLASGKLLVKLVLPPAPSRGPRPSRIESVALDATGKQALVASSTDVSLFDLESGQLIKATTFPAISYVAVAFTPKGPRAFLGTAELNGVMALDAATGNKLWAHDGVWKSMARVTLSPDASLGFALPTYERPRAWRLETGEESPLPIQHAVGQVFLPAPTGTLALVGSSGGNSGLSCLDLALPKAPVVWSRPEGATAVAFSPDGKLVASTWASDASSGPTDVVHLWDAGSGDERDAIDVSYMRRDAHALSCAFTPDGKSLIVGRGDGWLFRFELYASSESQGDERGQTLAALVEDVTTLAANEPPAVRERFEKARTALERTGVAKRPRYDQHLANLRRDRPLAAVPLLLEVLLVTDPFAERPFVREIARTFTVLTGKKIDTEGYRGQLPAKVIELTKSWWQDARSKRATDLASFDRDRLELVVDVLLGERAGYTSSAAKGAVEWPCGMFDPLFHLDTARSRPIPLIEESLSPDAAPIVFERAKDRPNRDPAVLLLAHMKTHGWEKAIVAAVADPTPEVRLAALLALWCSGDAMRCADLLALEKDATVPQNVRLTALVAVGFGHDKTAVPALLALLDDSDASLRHAAATALRVLDPAAAVSRLAPLLDKATEDEDVFTLLRAIGPAKTPEATDAIGRFLVRIDERGHFSTSILLEAVNAYEVVSGTHMSTGFNQDAKETAHRAAALWKHRAK